MDSKEEAVIVVDISEDKRVYEELEKKVGKDGFRIEQIGTFDCIDKKFPIKESSCVSKDEMEVLIEAKIYYNRQLCSDCKERKYIRFADFTNSTNSFYYERKTVLDFIGSRKRRLYEQLEKIDTFVEGRKGLILEGIGEYAIINDAVPKKKPYWKDIDKKGLSRLSPIQQVIKLDGHPEWTWSFVRNLKRRNMEFVQTWNLSETIDFLIQCNKGYDNTPKLRLIPKRQPSFSLEMNILALFDGIGEIRGKKILKNAKIKKDLNRLIGSIEALGYGKKM